MLEQSRELIAKAERFAAMDDEALSHQLVRTLLGDLAQALREATEARPQQISLREFGDWVSRRD